MAGSSMTFANDAGNDFSGARGNIRKLIITWVSDDTTGGVTNTTGKIAGRLIKAVIVPSGTAAPTDLYDVTITDEQSFNILTKSQRTLIDLLTATTEERYFLLLDSAGTPLAQSLHPVVCDKLTVTVANAGNSKAGTIYLYYLTD